MASQLPFTAPRWRALSWQQCDLPDPRGQLLRRTETPGADESKPQIPWLRVFVEGVVIVGSILLAFGIDAWWDGRKAKVLEQELLASHRRRVGLSTTSGSGGAAALRLPSIGGGAAVPFSSILSRSPSILGFSAFALL